MHPARPPRRRPSPLSIPLEDLACAGLFAFFAMQGSIPGISPPQALEVTGSAPTAVTTAGGIASQLFVNAVILLLLLRRPRLLLRYIPSLPWAGLLALLAVFSAAWSIDPSLTLRRSLPFALAGLFGLYFALRFPLPRQLAILRATMAALALATIAIVVLAPSIGLDHSPGHAADWQGVFTQKNACGRIMVLGTAAVFFSEKLTAARLALLPLFLFVLVMSGSRGAWLIEAAILLLWLALHAARRAGSRLRLVLVLAAPIVAAALAVAATVFFPHIALLIGRDPTLTGRTAIWTQVIRFIGRRPFFGYGYDAFWRGLEGPSFQIDAAVHFVVEHAHNGFLEILLELGAAGLVLFLLSWLAAFRRLWPLIRSGSFLQAAFPIAVLALIVLYNLDENTLLIHNGLFWPLYVAAIATIGSLARDHRHIAPSHPHGILSAFRETRPAPHNEALAAQEQP